MSKLLLQALGVLPLLLALPARAQLTTFYIPDQEAVHGEVVEVALSVAEFRAVAAAQLSMSWDAEQLEFLSVDDLALGATQAGNFNLRRSEAGQLAYTFIDPSLNGYDLADGHSLYKLRFRVLARAGEEAEIRFSEQPTRCVVGNPEGMEKPAQFVGGRVRVTAGAESNRPAEVQIQLQPNPFNERAQVLVELPEDLDGRLTVYDLEGRQVMSRLIDLAAGSHQLTLTAAELPAAGTYVLELSGESLRLTRKFVFTGSR